MSNFRLSSKGKIGDSHVKASVARNQRYQSEYHRCVELFAEPIKEVVRSVVYIDNTKYFQD